MHKLQLYVNNTRLDLFDDENVTIVDSMKNIRDVAKVFTTFSKQFTVPASKTNNKVFKHFYNYDIDNGFDARVKVDAKIEINNITFKKGKIKLDGVKIKNSVPYAYKVTFFGSVVDLKDIIGEDKLPSLTELQNTDLDYSREAIIYGMAANPGAYCVPLMTYDGTRLYYENDTDINPSGEILFLDKDSNPIDAIVPEEALKWAIRLDQIINAIENEPRYNNKIKFSSNSFFKSNDTEISKLYMALHRKKGAIDIVGRGSVSAPFTSLEGDPPFFDGIGSLNEDGGYVCNEEGQYFLWDVEDETYSVTPIKVIANVESTSYGKYDLIVKKNNEVMKRFDGLTGNQSLWVPSYDVADGDVITLEVNTYNYDVIFEDLYVEIRYRVQSQGAIPDVDTATTSTSTIEARYTFNVGEQIPEMKIMDFLSSLFKMFNLVAYVNDDNEIEVQPLYEFYTQKEQDITDYIDLSESEVNAALPYKEIFFKYEDTNSLLAAQHLQELSDIEWGGSEYTDINSDVYGTTYEVKPSFSHVKFEEIVSDSDENASTEIQYGYYVDDNYDEYLGKPIIFYCDTRYSQAAFKYVHGSGALFTYPAGAVICPSNLEDLTDNDSENIHFNAELNEYTNQLAENTLFERYYKTYIQSVFDSKNRLTKISAFLPPSRFISYDDRIDLSDVIVISGRYYRINSMKIDLITGKTDFELLNTDKTDISQASL